MVDREYARRGNARFSRVSLVGLCVVVCAALFALSLVACTSAQSDEDGNSGNASATGSAGAMADETDVAAIRIGTMPTEDLLPLYVAEGQGLFETAGVDAEIVVFDSAQNLSAAITAGEVDIAMTDPMRAAKLYESGVDVWMEWITLGSDASQGAFGILAPADAPYDTLEELAAFTEEQEAEGGDEGQSAEGESAAADEDESVDAAATDDEAQGDQFEVTLGVGVAANTVPEYVFDMLCAQAGIDPADIGYQEIASLPDRYQMVASGNIAAAALPSSMLELGRASGLKVLADDTSGDNISQSVMIARRAYLEDAAGAAAVEAVRAVWDEAASAINANPEAYREVLIANANLNEAVSDSYPISVYPLSRNADGSSAHPAASLIEPQLDWMLEKGYLDEPLSYDETDGSFSKTGA